MTGAELATFCSLSRLSDCW